MIHFSEGGEYRKIEALPDAADSSDYILSELKNTDRATYFGALAAAENGYLFAVKGYHKLETAIETAVQTCGKRLGGWNEKGQPCRLRMVLVPKGYKGETGFTLSERGGVAWRRYLSKEGPKAFAYGPPSGYASNFARVSIPFARAHDGKL
jgi:hypothetical protein|tara:strand:+ start:257 stop:709 length:453 start_codon:yes stop_codon:yes gene_type:complete